MGRKHPDKPPRWRRRSHAPVAVGARYERWTVLALADATPSRQRWSCRCDCGTVKTVRDQSLKAGTSRSCGCLQVEVATRQCREGTVHGESHRTVEYWLWVNIRRRCYARQLPDYRHYGGRGITMCERWRESYQQFLIDVGRRPTPDHTLDRIDNNGNYEPGNVRWATRKEQSRNQRTNLLITIGGQTKCLSEWSEVSGIPACTIRQRLAVYKWPPARLLEPVRKHRPYRSGVHVCVEVSVAGSELEVAHVA